MSAQNGLLLPCEAIQDDLYKYFQTCSDYSEPIPFYEYLLSPLNRGNLQQLISPGDGKILTGRLKYTPRIPITSVGEDGTHPTCTATTVRGDNWQDYTIDRTRNVYIEEQITLTDLVEVCKPNSMIFAEKIAKMLDAIDRKQAYRLAEDAIVLAGNWGTDVTGVDAQDHLEVPTYRTGTTDSLHPQTMQKIKRATQQSGYCDAYGIFTGATLADYAEAIQLGCCTDYGMDLAATFAKFGTAVMYDRAISQAFGDEDFALVVMNGALQVVTWNLYDQAPWAVMNQGDYIQMKMMTRRGLPVDFMAKFDCGVWDLRMTATAEVKAMPLDMFAAGDPFFGVNMVNKVEVVNS